MDEQQLKEAFMQYLQQKSGAQTQQEFERYVQQLGEEGLQQEYAQFMELLKQQQISKHKLGGMLNYIQKLRGGCPDGYEMQFFKKGGQICKTCVQKVKAEETPKNAVDAFKCGRKMKNKITKAGDGVKTNVPTAKPVQTVKKVVTYPKQLEGQERVVTTYSDGTQSVMNSGWGSDGWMATFRGRQGEYGNTNGTPRQRFVADSLYIVDDPGSIHRVVVPTLPVSKEQVDEINKRIMRNRRWSK